LGGGVSPILFSNSNLIKSHFSYTYFAKLASAVFSAFLLFSSSATAAICNGTDSATVFQNITASNAFNQMD
jgi:hypothetical protein